MEAERLREEERQEAMRAEQTLRDKAARATPADAFGLLPATSANNSTPEITNIYTIIIVYLRIEVKSYCMHLRTVQGRNSSPGGANRIIPTWSFPFLFLFFLPSPMLFNYVYISILCLLIC